MLKDSIDHKCPVLRETNGNSSRRWPEAGVAEGEFLESMEINDRDDPLRGLDERELRSLSALFNNRIYIL